MVENAVVMALKFKVAADEVTGKAETIRMTDKVPGVPVSCTTTAPVQLGQHRW